MTQNNDNIEVDVDLTYTFNVSGKTSHDFTMSTAITEWLNNNLSNLRDDDDKIIFSKVNNGFNENTLKSFGVKPVCDVYIDNIEYKSDFDVTRPSVVHTIIIFYLKGANNNAYQKICELHDYIMQEFATNEEFRVLDGIVKDTFIHESRVVTNTVNTSKWRVMGALELSHALY